jgi:hypothetical protein
MATAAPGLKRSQRISIVLPVLAPYPARGYLDHDAVILRVEVARYHRLHHAPLARARQKLLTTLQGGI